MTEIWDEDEFDEVEEIAYSQPKGREAEGLEAHGRSLEPGSRLRAEVFRAAADWWRMRERLDDALRCAEEAVADGGPAWIDPRGELIGVLLALEDPRADDAIREVRQDLRNMADNSMLIEVVSEDLVEAGRQKEALRWLNIGLADLDPDDIIGDDTHLHGLLQGRYRIRRYLDMRQDPFDAAAQRVQRFIDERERRESGDWGVDDGSRMTLLHWPEPEFERLSERWPDMVEGYGGSAAEHRTETERHLRSYADEGITVAVGLGVLQQLLDHAEEQGIDPRTGMARARYAAELGRSGRATAWPPGRNDPCWCGSGVKYKRCCGLVR